jgi:hypothetical protein
VLTESAGNVFTKITGSSAAPALTRGDAEVRTERIQEYCASSFLLDWLAGADACRRNIQGFSFKF